MRDLFKAAIAGSIASLIGLLIGFMSIGQAFEENVGLSILFSVRGIRRPPKEIVIVAIDKVSSKKMGLSEGFKKWPRSLHARLIEHLRDQGAAVIVFDMAFEERQSLDDDRTLEQAITRAGNVVLCCYLKSENVGRPGGMEETEQRSGARARLLKVALPLPTICRAAAAVAPLSPAKGAAAGEPVLDVQTGSGRYSHPSSRGITRFRP